MIKGYTLILFVILPVNLHSEKHDIKKHEDQVSPGIFFIIYKDSKEYILKLQIKEENRKSLMDQY